MEIFEKNIQEAIKHLQIADHMTYVTLPIVNENRLLLKILEEIYRSITNSIKTILNYEYLYRQIKIYKESKKNLEIFVRIAKRYNISNEEIKRIKEVLELYKKHKESPIEFVKRDRFIIMSNNLQTKILDINLIKEYLLLAKETIIKINQKIKNR